MVWVEGSLLVLELQFEEVLVGVVVELEEGFGFVDWVPFGNNISNNHYLYKSLFYKFVIISPGGFYNLFINCGGGGTRTHASLAAQEISDLSQWPLCDTSR